MLLFLQCLGLVYLIGSIFMALGFAIEAQTGLYKSCMKPSVFIKGLLLAFFLWPLIVTIDFWRSK